MNEDIRQATKAQAAAVRAYLATLGVSLSHVQALEVIARGEGLRSRHVLAQQTASPAHAVAAGSPAVHTCMAYGYTDGANCKRASQLVFRGRLTPAQLRFMVSKLDAGRYFIPVQIGFESLQLAFTDEGGDDHAWHHCTIPDEAEWQFDSEGYVLTAGDIAQVPNAAAYATDADVDNLFYRFARLTRWESELQKDALNTHVWRRPQPFPHGVHESDVTLLVQHWQRTLALARVPESALAVLAERVLEEGFLPFPGGSTEVRRRVAPNAYQFCILESCDPEYGDFQVNFDVSTLAGQYLTETPVLAVDAHQMAAGVSRLQHLVEEQLRRIRVMPEAYDSRLE